MNAAIDQSAPRATWMTAADGARTRSHAQPGGRRPDDGDPPRELPLWTAVSYLQAEAPRRRPRGSAA